MAVPLVDAHAHLGDPVFDADRGSVLARAAEAGVARVITVGETLDDARRILALAGEHPQVAPAAGLYPTRLDPAAARELEHFIRDNRDRLFAIGEVGLDHWVVKDEEGLRRQREIFLAQVNLAQELDLPLNVHSRSAGRHTIAALVETGARRVLMHAFDGRAGAALEGARAGFYFSVPPSIVRSPQKQKLVRALPLERLLLETDSPVLGPAPGERNEPANVRISLRAIAELKHVTEEAVARATTANAVRLFGERLIDA